MCLLAVSERLTVLVLAPLHQDCEGDWINCPDSLFLSLCSHTEHLQMKNKIKIIVLLLLLLIITVISSNSSSCSSSSDV